MRIMREIRIKLKKARKNAVAGAMTEIRKDVATHSHHSMSAHALWKRRYWLITLYWGGKGACPYTSYLKKPRPCAKRRKRCLNVHRYIKCLNHEIMHAVLYDVVGENAYDQWDNIVKTNYRGERYKGKRYGWVNIIGAYLPDVYCRDD